MFSLSSGERGEATSFVVDEGGVSLNLILRGKGYTL